MNNPEPQYLYLTTTGWKSGRPHEIEIWFVQEGPAYYLVSEMGQRAHWIQNLSRNPAVTFRIAVARYSGQARIVNPRAEPELAAAVRARMDAKYGWSKGMIVELRPD